MHEPTPTGVFVHLHCVPRYPAVFTVLNDDPEVIECPEEADVPFHVFWGNEWPRCTLYTDDISRRPSGGSTTNHIDGVGSRPNQEWTEPPGDEGNGK